MTFAQLASSHIDLTNSRMPEEARRISMEDGRRQEQAAAEILARFRRQPGVVLADEVGMGKTFVAMAVATSILLERGDGSPIVIMSPPSLREKWPKDWKVFTEMCLPPSLQTRFRAAAAHSGIEFLRLLDDDPARRKHIVFLTHGALNRSLGDGFARLAVIKRAFKGRSSLATQRASFKRWASRLLRLDWVEHRSEGLLGDLLDRPCESWLTVIHRADDRLKERIDDDPVPTHFADALDEMDRHDLDELVEQLRQLPQRESKYLDDRLRETRRALNAAMENVWGLALRRARFTSPLLILDEAHHVKNPGTRLASLFATEESLKDSEYFEQAGPLGGKFERMLFLTATPFQLGHAELLRVLDRFEGIKWSGPHSPSLSLSNFKTEIGSLGQILDDAQAAALRLDRAWSRLEVDTLRRPDGTLVDPDEWWLGARENGDGLIGDVVQQVGHTHEAMQRAEASLAPWVLRHLKSPHLPGTSGVERRTVLTGAAIRDGSPHSGLEITPPVLLPFLLAGRAQSLLAKARGRALFAEGLASSFEAYLETRAGRSVMDEDADASDGVAPPELEWYLTHLDRALPKQGDSVKSAHPKIAATAERAVALWRAGEKVLIFCHYRATGRALRQHISALLDAEIGKLAASKLPGTTPAQALGRLDSLGQRFFDDDGLRQVVDDWVWTSVRPFSQHLSLQDGEQIVEIVRRFVRTPSFLVRYLPLDTDDVASAFQGAVDTVDGGYQSLRQKVDSFCRFLAERCLRDERDEFIAALKDVQTGTHYGVDVRATLDDLATDGPDEMKSRKLLPNVRLANGEVRHETRRRLLLTFNTPLFPEILIASSVLAEGVDLHLNCRYVIHHDLSWNPSTLEQRSGRVDRIGSKAEQVKQPIHLYLPYVAETQDEKMFKVVRDRERWFQIVMGETYEVDEAATDARAARVPLPFDVQRQLAMRLHP